MLNTLRTQCSLITFITLSLFSCTPASDKTALKKPYKTYEVTRHDPHQIANCSDFPAFTKSLTPPSKYQQNLETKDRLNDKNAKIYQEVTQPIRIFTKHLVALVNDIVVAEENHVLSACYIYHLKNWASHNALLTKDTNNTGMAVRKWALASIAASYARLELQHAIDITSQGQIELWLSMLAAQVIDDYRNRPARLRNNHDYWAAWAVINVAVITNNRQYYAWAHKQWIEAMTDIDSRGFLAHELQRGTRVREYHNFAAMPLVGLAAFIKVNELVNNKTSAWMAYERLITLMTNNIFEYSDFEQQAGSQMTYDILQGGRLAWVPVHLSIFGVNKDTVCRLQQIIKKFPPNSYSRLGGNTAEYYLNQSSYANRQP
jgi:poly(beta-D-mannuronate) lyase